MCINFKNHYNGNYQLLTIKMVTCSLNVKKKFRVLTAFLHAL